MKRTYISALLVGVFLLSAATSNLYSSINFGSKESVLKVSSGAKLKVSSSTGLPIDGTFIQETGTASTLLTFEDGTNINLTESSTFGASGHWNFLGTAHINGNGEILDLSAGGQISIAAGEKLYLGEIVIKGLGTGKGSINFGSATSELHVSNSTLVLDADLTISSGKVIVDGPLTIILKGNVLKFTTNGKLTINDTVLWLEQLDQVIYPNAGALRFTVGSTNYDIYDLNGFNQTNTTAAETAELLTLNDNALIKQTMPQADLTPAEAALLSGNLTSSISLERDLIIQPGRVITVGGNVSIDGNGVTISFSQPSAAQFTIAEGKTVTLKNVTLSGIGASTFSFGNNSHIRFGEGVTLELIEDVTFAPNTTGTGIAALVRVLDATAGANTVTIRGLGAARKLTFTAPTTSVSQRTLQMSDNIVRLEKIECVGLDSNVLTPGIDAIASVEYPQVILGGDAAININGKKKNESSTTEHPRTSIDVFAAGTNNTLNLLRDGINYGGAIEYGNLPRNELFVNFNSQNLSTERTGVNKNNAIPDGCPFVTLSGVGIAHYSEIVEDSDPVRAAGTAFLKFNNANAAVEIYDQDAFTIDVGAELYHTNLHLIGYPLKQNSSSVIIEGTTLVGDVDKTPVRMLHKGDRKKKIVNRRQVHMALFEKQQARELREEQELLEVMKNVKDVAQKVTPKPDAMPTTKTLSLPTTLDSQATKVAQYEGLEKPFEGNISYDRSTITNVVTFSTSGSVSTYTPFNLVLESDNKVYLDSVDMKLNRVAKRSSSQLINVRGVGNEIYVNKTFTFKSNLFLGEGAELTFVFDNDGSATPTVVLDTNCLLELEKNATLRFKGDGKVVLSDGVLVYFRGTADTSKTKTGYATNKSRVILTDGAVLDFAKKATACFGGLGVLEVRNGAKVAPSTVCDFTIGSPRTYTAATSADSDPTYAAKTATYTNLDDFDIVVSGGEVRFDLPASLATTLGDDWDFKARLGMQYATLNIVCEAGGTLTVGNNALLDVNCNSKLTGNDRFKAGRIRTLSFAYNGAMFVKSGGKITMAPSVLAPAAITWMGQTVAKAAELPFLVIVSTTAAAGAGTVAYVSKIAASETSGTYTPTKVATVPDFAAVTAGTFVAGLITA